MGVVRTFPKIGIELGTYYSWKYANANVKFKKSIKQTPPKGRIVAQW